MKPSYAELESLLALALKQIQILQEKVADLEAKLGKNSRNSSKPSSSDQKPNQIPKPKAEKRPFHSGASRQLLPESMVTSREERRIDSCPRCRSGMVPTGEVIKWQQVELPDIKPLVHQWELHVCRCPKCELVATPELQPSEQLLLAPRLEALINLCLGRFRLGHLMVREFVATLVPHLKLSQGLISKVKRRAARALEAPRQQIMAKILETDAPKCVDATGWRHLGVNEHVIVTRVSNLVAFHFVSHQNKATIASLLPGKRLQLVSDRGLAVGGLDLRTHQYCLTHLLRNIEGLADHPLTTLQEAQQLGELHEGIQLLFVDKHRLDRNEISESTWRQYGYRAWQHLKELVEKILEGNPSKKVRRALRRIQREWNHFMVYLRCRDHPMTNNAAEESLRALVIARKLCFGSRSEHGRKWRAAIQSCIETLHRHDRSILDFLTNALQADRTKCPCPNTV